MQWAFDKGMFTVDDQRRLFVPENVFFRSDANSLHYHQSNIYGLFKTAGSLVKATGYYANAVTAHGMIVESTHNHGE